MSAPNAGRDSPDPERQTGAQQQDVPGSGKVGGEETDKAQQAGKDTSVEGLESNPKGPLEDAAQEKLSKGKRGETA